MKLNAARKKLPASSFGLSKTREYPIEDKAHARAALSRASANATPAEQKTIARKVKAKYPSIKIGHWGIDGQKKKFHNHQ